MDDYEAIDISRHANAGRTLVGDGSAAESGVVTLRGIPFRIGDPADTRKTFVVFGPGFQEKPLRIVIDREAHSIVFAHLLLDTRIPEGGPVGEQIAEYVFELEHGDRVTVPIRELFEIGVLPHPDASFAEMIAWRVAASPLLAAPSRFDSLLPRREGPWAVAGRRMTEAAAGLSTGYKLWSWRNRTGGLVRSVEIRPRSSRFLIAAVTVGYVDEDLFVRVGREPVVIHRLEPKDLVTNEDLEVVVDRGVATYAWPTISDAVSQPSLDRAIGWGHLGSAADPAYAEVAALPSARVEVRQAGRLLGAVRWGDVIANGRGEDGQIRVEWVDRSRTWVHTTVIDRETATPVPCRIHFRSQSGIPYQPHGHHNHVNGDMPSWHVDVGGDIRFGAVPYAVIDGRCQGWLPVGDVTVEVVRGFEYEPLRSVVHIEPGQRELTLEIGRWANVRAKGWFSGDTHVHFLSVDGSHLEAAAEDLDVVNLLQAQWGHLFTNIEDFSGRPSISPERGTIVHVGQENRQHVLGHLGLLGLREPVMPWSSDGAEEAEIGGSLEATLSHWADEGRAHGALVTAPHAGYPNGETSTLVATGRVDAFEMIFLAPYFHEEYYRYLNAGYRLPLVGGTDKMSNEVPVGLYRTYVRLDAGEPFTYEAWKQNVAKGRTFLSGGPLLHLEVEGREVGDSVRLKRRGGTVHVAAKAESAWPIQILQIVEGGRIIAEAREPAGTRRLEIRESIQLSRDTWLAARAGGPEYFDASRYLDPQGRGAFAHTSPVYVVCGDDEWSVADEAALTYLITRVDAGRAYVRDVAARSHLGRVYHRHSEADHLAYLERPFIEARANLMARRREHLRRSPARLNRLGRRATMRYLQPPRR